MSTVPRNPSQTSADRPDRPLPRGIARLPVAPAPPGWRLRAAWRAGGRLRGLLGVSGVPPDVGLWLRPARSVHTAGMRCALDLVWLDVAGEVVALHEDVGPWRHRACRAAGGGVVEVAAGRGEALAHAIGAAGGLRGPDGRPGPAAVGSGQPVRRALSSARVASSASRTASSPARVAASAWATASSSARVAASASRSSGRVRVAR